MRVQDAGTGVQVARMKSNALFFQPMYVFRYLRKGYVSQENDNASNTRSFKTEPEC